MITIFSKFDKYLWRVNGVLIFGVSLSLFLFIAFGIYLESKRAGSMESNSREIRINNKVNSVDENLRLRQIEMIRGTEYAMVALSAEEKSIDRSFDAFRSNTSPGKTNVRNYLIMNIKTKVSHWVWSTNKNSILSDNVVCNRDCYYPKATSIGIMFELVELDSNKDKYLNGQDLRSIHFYSLSQYKNIPIVSAIDRVHGVQAVDDNSVIFFYSKDDNNFFKTIDLKTGMVSAPTRISKADSSTVSL